MNTVFDKILSSSGVELLAIGLIAGVIGGSNSLQIGNYALHIDNSGFKTFMVIAGYVATGMGLIFILLELIRRFGEFRHKSTGDEKFKEETRFEGNLEDLYLSTDIFSSKKLEFKPISTNKKRVWEYTLSNVSIKRFTEKLGITFTATIKRSGRSSSYSCTGVGPFNNGVAYIQYEFTPLDQNKNELPWKGVMVLIISANQIRGIWLTTKIQGDNRFPVGRISLER